jgi:APA family basic amino acid/polyamine antiporter
VGLCVASVAALTPINVISELVSIGTLLAFIIVCGGVWILRRRGTTVPRAFVAPWIPFTPFMGIAISLVMMISLGWESWARLLIWLAIGLILYFFYGRKHSKVQMLTGAKLETH